MLYLPTPVDGVCYDCDPTDPCAAENPCWETLGCGGSGLQETYNLTYEGDVFVVVLGANPFYPCYWYWDPPAGVSSWTVFKQVSVPRWTALRAGERWTLDPYAACDPTGEYKHETLSMSSFWLS
jgi:hypothetical protein